MSYNDTNSNCNDKLQLCGFEESTSPKPNKKPLEIYIFIDPMCPECWALEPIIKKLQVEYGNYFTTRYVIGGKLQCCKQKKANIDKAKAWEKTAKRTGMPCNGDVWLENPISTPFSACIAIKAAELQGKQIGTKYLRKLREVLFLDKQNIEKEEVLLDCALKIEDIDIVEFKKDLNSEAAIKAFQCDLKTTKEMDVECFPTLVVFNDNVEDEGLMVTGLYEYKVYVNVLQEILKEEVKAERPQFLENFIKEHTFVATKEIAVVYDLSNEEVEKEMRKLALQQVVEQVPVKYGTFWRYIGKSNNE